ncbi:MAG TPA: M1 family metallopeptidase [Thermoanaerobaculia bacterium]|jgi:leukotriene A-4 hydrolase/aminopeptidase|nr:M1 family metallopeptidase [Thermoanaerobaculia bacterium]
MKRLSLIVLFVAAACRNEKPATATQVQPTPHQPSTAVAQRDPHSYANPDQIRVEHIALDLTVDFAKKQLGGTATLKVRHETDAGTLILDTNGLTISRVTAGNTPVQFRLAPADPVFGSKLEIPLPRQADSVTIAYTTSPGARALQWLEPSMTAGKKHPFLLSQSQAILARTWVPCQDTPGVRFTYDATIHVPKELLAVMSAENPQARNEEGVYQFRMPHPIPSYLLAVAVGDLEFRPFDTRSGVYAEPEVIERAAYEFADTPKMIHAAEELYGPYRWGRYDLLVLPPSFPYGGMENPRLTFLTPTVLAGDRSLVALIAHELAHSWSGNLVTNATWNDFWLNEGFTTYFEHRISEKLYGREYAEMLWLLGVTEVQDELKTLPAADQHLYVNLAGRDPDEAPTLVYEKGALFLRLLEETAGRARWDQFLRAYFEKFAFQPMTTQIFVDHLKSALPDVVQKVNVDQWIHGEGLPPNAPKPQSQAFTRVEEQAKAFAAGGKADAIDAAKWASHERVHFIQSLPALTPERMKELDDRFHFSDSGNSEVLSAWLEKSIDARYKGAYPAIERFLTTQGRRKFLKPIYEKLAKNPEDLAFARRIYAKARETYHPVSQGTIDTILK